MGYRASLLVALLVGLAAASVPFLASTREHCGDGPRPPEDAPRYLLLASNAVAADLLCGVPAEAIRFERVTSTDAVSQRIEDEAIAGVVFDRAMYETVPGGVPRQWLTAGSGRVIIGLQMTRQEVDLRMEDPPSSFSSLPPEQAVRPVTFEGGPTSVIVKSGSGIGRDAAEGAPAIPVQHFSQGASSSSPSAATLVSANNLDRLRSRRIRDTPSSSRRGKIMDEKELHQLGLVFAQREAADSEAYPVDNIEDLKAAHLLGAPFRDAAGGRGWTLPDAISALEVIASYSPSTGLIWSMPLGLAGIYALGAEAAPQEHRPAWEAQREEVAAHFRAGRLYAACNSERGAGGSLAGMQTVATRADDGKFRIRGEKILASSGEFAQTFFSAAKVSQEDVPGAGVVEFFFVPVDAPGVLVQSDWDGFGMRSTESHTVRYEDATPEAMMGFPNFMEAVQPLQYWFCLFTAIPLGCARGILRELSSPAPQSPALRLRLSEALMRYEALHAYLLETAAGWRSAAGPEYAARVLRTKTYVTQEAVSLCASLYALSGGRHYRRTDPLARLLADSFAGTSLRPPLALALDTLVEQFQPGEL